MSGNGLPELNGPRGQRRLTVIVLRTLLSLAAGSPFPNPTPTLRISRSRAPPDPGPPF